MRLRSLTAIVFVLAALGLSSQATADLVLNGNFESGDFSQWSGAVTTDLYSGVDTSGIYLPSSPSTATAVALIGPAGAPADLFQSLATTPGQHYVLSFSLANDVDGSSSFPNSWSVSFDGNQIDGGVNVLYFDYTTPTYTLLATSATTELSFSFQNDSGYFYLTNVSLTPTPAPSTLVVSAGILFLAGLGKWRRKAVA